MLPTTSGRSSYRMQEDVKPVVLTPAEQELPDSDEGTIRLHVKDASARMKTVLLMSVYAYRTVKFLKTYYSTYRSIPWSDIRFRHNNRALTSCCSGMDVQVRSLTISQLLYNKSVLLDNSRTLTSLGLKTGDIIDAYWEPELDVGNDPVKPRLENADGKVEVIRIFKNTTMFWVKRIYANRIKVPLNALRFGFNGKPLSDDETSVSLNLQELDSIERGIDVYQEVTGGSRSSLC